MLCIQNSHTDPYFNVAAEEFLFKHMANEAIFLMWQNKPSVIIGKHQDVNREVNLDFARKKQIKVVRRISGGGAVYHDLGNINLSFMENSDNANFDKFSNKMINFLQTIGIDAQSDERRGLTIDGLKISGSAQYIYKNKALFHASLLFSSDLTTLEAVLNSRLQQPAEQDKVYVHSVKSPVTNISEHLLHPLSIETFKQLIMQYFTNNPDYSGYTFNPKELKEIDDLKNQKYSTASWNFGEIQPAIPT
jgi:lipoate-protein ligase A